MELIALVHPETGKPTGKIITRKELFEQKGWCRTTNVYVLNSRGDILCHQRSMEKERFPGVWFTHLGGHVGAEESYESNALKEIEEEAGICISQEDLIPWRTTRLDDHRIWIREYVTIINTPADLLIPQAGEVDRFEWQSVSDIIANTTNFPELWHAGTHDFLKEYEYLRVALTAHSHKAHLEVSEHIQTWGGTLGGLLPDFSV